MTNDTLLESSDALLLESAKKFANLQNLVLEQKCLQIILFQIFNFFLADSKSRA